MATWTPPTLYHYYMCGEAKDLTELHSIGKMGELHKACDGQTSWSGYHLNHMDYKAKGPKGKYGKVQYSYKEAKQQYDTFCETGHPWRNYMLCETDIPEGFKAMELDNGPIIEGISDKTALGMGNGGPIAPCKCPSTATGVRAVQQRADLHLLEGPGKAGRMGDGNSRRNFARQSNTRTGAVAPWRPEVWGVKVHTKEQRIKPAEMAAGKWSGDRENWDAMRAARAN